jgi:hypothetical protein
VGVWGRLMNAVGAFRRAFLNPELGASAPTDFDAFSRWESRVLRYQFLWALYGNTAFWDEVHRWAAANKVQHGLYAYTRPNFNPVQRIVEFGATHLIGGTLDPKAGDGVKVRTALPIDTGSPAVRTGLARLWRDSRMSVEKDVIARNGTALGDIAIRACDDVDGGRVVLKSLHPGTVRWVKRDWHTGRIAAYLLEEQRYDPMAGRDARPLTTARAPGVSCTYNEEAWVEDGKVHYRTYRNGGLFDWRLRPDGTPFGSGPGAMPEWEVPYGFVPLVLIQHMAVGLPWGLAEAHSGVAKILELADVGSNIGDYVRRILNDVVLITGVVNPQTDVQPAKDDIATGGNPQPGRTKRKIGYLSDVNAKVLHVTQDLNIPGVSGHAKALKDDATEDYPEIDMDLWKTGDPSGRAVRLARQRAESKVQQRRVGYDLGLEDIGRMALALAGIRGYEGYETLGTDDPFNDPVVAHSLMHRPVFAPDPLDDIEERAAEYEMFGKGVAAGFPLPWLMKQWGYDQKAIDEVTRAKEDDEAAAMERVKQRMGMAGASQDDNAADDGGGAPDSGDLTNA